MTTCDGCDNVAAFLVVASDGKPYLMCSYHYAVNEPFCVDVLPCSEVVA